MIITIDLINQFLQLGCMAAATILAACLAIRRPGAWFYQQLTGAFACYFLGDLFYTLYLLILNDYAPGISAAGVSYIGSYCFLLSIGLGLTGEWTEADKRSAKPYRRISFIAPVVVILLYLANVCLAGNPVINALFSIPLAFLAYYTLLLFLTSKKSAPSIRGYHRTVLLFLFAENMMFLTSSFGFDIPFMVFDFMMSFTVLLMLRAAKKGVAA